MNPTNMYMYMYMYMHVYVQYTVTPYTCTCTACIIFTYRYIYCLKFKEDLHTCKQWTSKTIHMSYGVGLPFVETVQAMC